MDDIAFVNSLIKAIKLAEESLGVQCGFTLLFVICCAWGMLIAMFLLAGKTEDFHRAPILQNCSEAVKAIYKYFGEVRATVTTLNLQSAIYKTFWASGWESGPTGHAFTLEEACHSLGKRHAFLLMLSDENLLLEVTRGCFCAC